MRKYFNKMIDRLVRSEKSSKKLAASFSLGTFIALTPTIPFQTPLLFLLSWILRLNSAVTFAAVYLVNNPFTMVPIYIIDYAFGAWFFQKVVGIDLVRYNPWWVEKFNAFLSRYIDVKKYFGADFCFWCLILGGLLFALLISVPLYPILKYTCDRLIKKFEHMNRGYIKTDENNRAE